MLNRLVMDGTYIVRREWSSVRDKIVFRLHTVVITKVANMPTKLV